MRLFKPTYKDKNGKKKKCQHWYIGFTDNQGNRQRLPAFSNKRASDDAKKMIEELLSPSRTFSPELQGWLERIPNKMRDNLVKFGLIDNNGTIKHLGKTLKEHLVDFHAGLLAKENGKRYSRQVKSRLEFIFDSCGFKTWNDIDANSLYTFLGDLRDKGLGQRSFNCYLKFAKQFCKWMIRERRAMPPSPVEHLCCITQTEKRWERRALDEDKLLKLLETTENAPEWFGTTGRERYWIYRLAAETGLRRGQLEGLKVSSFDFDNLTVKAVASYSKNKKENMLPLRPETAASLQQYLANKMPDAKAFKVPEKTAKMLKRDLADAKIPYRNGDGEVFDFHAIRHTFCTTLGRDPKVPPRVAQKLMQHQSSAMTDRYTHIRLLDERKALEALPDFSNNGTKTEERKKA